MTDETNERWSSMFREFESDEDVIKNVTENSRAVVRKILELSKNNKDFQIAVGCLHRNDLTSDEYDFTFEISSDHSRTLIDLMVDAVAKMKQKMEEECGDDSDDDYPDDCTCDTP